MTTKWEPVPDSRIAELITLPAGVVNLRRDLHLFVSFVRPEGLKRSHRGNTIPKGPALKLAKILSWAGEADAVDENDRGSWSNFVSFVARDLGLVTFEVEGKYLGYSSSAPSFPDNVIEVVEPRVTSWLASSPSAKERSILDSLIRRKGNEFFQHATLVAGERFDSAGCAIGPASRMDLARIRDRLLGILCELPTNVWLPIATLIDHVRATAPHLILDPALRKVPLEDWQLRQKKRGLQIDEKVDDLYWNFREFPSERGGRVWGKEIQLTEKSSDGFRRVEGRFLQYFLQEIPYLCGFVDLALEPRHRESISLPLNAVAAFRLTPRLKQVVRREPSLDEVSVTFLPNFEVLVVAQSWPDRELATLSPFTKLMKEDGPTHMLRLDQKSIVAFVAKNPNAPSVKSTLQSLSQKPLPTNVASELDAWSGHAQKLTIFDQLALIELRGPSSVELRAELGSLAADDGMGRFVLATDPERAISVLEQRLRVPRTVTHTEDRYHADWDSEAGSDRKKAKSKPEPKPKRQATLTTEDLIGCRSDDPELLRALQKALVAAGRSCWLVEGELLVVSAADLSQVRATLRKLDDFEVFG
ncbi:MAG: hypothetical protein HY791_08145 [Deltaproteobacteria bacterium]|nr:hypothetical protein [Deltaproteobacteria bacterium]